MAKSAEDRSTAIHLKLDKLEQKYGKGATYTVDERKLIARGIVPEWVMRGRKMLSGPVQENCQKAFDALQKLHAQVWDRVSDQDERAALEHEDH